MEIKEAKQINQKLTNNLSFSVLYLDGLLMINIDFSRILVALANEADVSLTKMLERIYTAINIDDHIKEVAFHITCFVQAFALSDTVTEQEADNLLSWALFYAQSKFISKKKPQLYSHFCSCPLTIKQTSRQVLHRHFRRRKTSH